MTGERGNRNPDGRVWCPGHQKVGFFHKADAKRVVRIMGGGMRTFRCEFMHQIWHIGHLPRLVVAGELTVTEYYALTERQRAQMGRRARERVERLADQHVAPVEEPAGDAGDDPGGAVEKARRPAVYRLRDAVAPEGGHDDLDLGEEC